MGERTSDPSNGRTGRAPIVALVAVAVLLGSYFAVACREGVLLYGDEYHSVRNLDHCYTELWSSYDRFGSGVALPLFQRLALDLVGPSVWAYRAPGILGAIAALLIVYPMAARFTDRVPAAIATLALSTNSMHVFYSRFGGSYALAIFLGIALVYAARRVAEPGPRGRWYVVLAVCTGLLPWVHLVAAGFVAAVGLAALATAALRGQTALEWLRLLGSLVAGALLCVLLYLPAYEPLWAFVQEKAIRGPGAPFGALDVAALLAGGRTLAVVWLIGVPAAAVWLLVERRSAALLPVAAALGPVAALLVARPHGLTYAYARYLAISVPFMLMLLSWLLVRVLEALRLREPLLGRLALAAGAALVALSLWSGPLGRRAVDDGPFGNAYLSLMSLPAFDAPWPETPAFYATLDPADPVRLIEAPELTSRTALLYRNYYLQHGQPVAMGVRWDRVPAGPYLRLDADAVAASDADYLVVHLKVYDELGAYWDFVHEQAWPGMLDPELRSLMDAHRTVPWWRRNLSDEAEKLAEALGPPVYSDHYIRVWKLR